MPWNCTIEALQHDIWHVQHNNLQFPAVMHRCEEEREYLKKQQAEVEHKLESVCKIEADAKAEAKHAQLRYEDREHELNERAALLRRQETELVRVQRVRQAWQAAGGD